MRGDQFIRVPGDTSVKVTWKNFPVIVVFVALLISLTTSQSPARLVVLHVLAGASYVLLAVAAFMFAFVVVRALRLTRHPAIKLGRMLAKGRTAEALELGRTLLEQRPDDPLALINITAAFEAAGYREEAGRAFDRIVPPGLSKELRPAYEHWCRVLGRPGPCPRCGYDLRATPERCPECGSTVLAAQP